MEDKKKSLLYPRSESEWSWRTDGSVSQCSVLTQSLKNKHAALAKKINKKREREATD